MTSATLDAKAVPISAGGSLSRRILFVDHTAKMGGGEIALLNLCQQIDRARFTPSVLLFSEGPLADALRKDGVDVIVLPTSSAVLETRKGAIGFASVLKLRAAWGSLTTVFGTARVIRRGKFELVHTNSLKADLIGGLAGRLAGRKVVWHVRDRIEDDYLPGRVVRAFRFLARWIPHLVIGNSNAVLRSITSASPETFGRPTRVVYEGTPVPPRVDEPIMADWSTPRVVLVGRLAKWKGQHVFIDAAAIVHRAFPAARFQVIGSAMFDEQVYEAGLREQIARLNLQDVVEMTGFRSDVPLLMRDAHLVVHASTTGEPFGQVITEGMAVSKPVVATRGGGVPEIVEHGITGLLVPMGDAPAMAEAICQILAKPEAAVEMGRRGYDRVRDHFSIQHTAAGVHAVYEQLLGVAPR